MPVTISKRAMNTLLCYIPLGSETVTFSSRLSAIHFFYMRELYSQPFGLNPDFNMLLQDERSVTQYGMICYRSWKNKELEAFTEKR